MSPILSIVYVYYNTPEEIINSINSLDQALGNMSCEIIIVDNASIKNLPNDLGKRINIKIVKNKKNVGYGKGLNQGVSLAQGEYVLLVNPDTIFKINSIKYLLDKIGKNPKIGIIAPQLIDENGKYLRSISDIPFLPQSLFIFSFINRIWANNPISNTYYKVTWNKNIEHEVDMVSGACMLVKKLIFNEIHGFDERFFMYFEEADFCYRVKKLGYKTLYYPKAKVVHLIGKSNSNKGWIKKTFEQSRFKFFRKYHGIIPAFFGEAFIRLFKLINILLLIILFISAYLNFYKINDRMIFIGDQGWFYVSARDFLIYHNFPLVGITASHTWLHQGPLWTYFLALIFKISNFNPIAPGYLTAFLGIATVLFIYKIGKEMFSKRVGLISSLLYSVSPLAIINSQMPYHTSFIPLLTLLLIYFVYMWTKGNINYFPLIIFFLSLLYNFELATQILWISILIIFISGFIKSKKWALDIFNKKIIFSSVFLFILPMLPIILYDINHNFAQTFKLFAWVVYKTLSQIFNITSILNEKQSSFMSIFNFLTTSYQNLIFISNYVVSLLICILRLTYVFYRKVVHKPFTTSFDILTIFILIPVVGIFINATPSGAHIPLLFPSVIIFTAWFFDKIMNVKILLFPVIILLIMMAIYNGLYILNPVKSESAYRPYFSERLNAVKEILKEVDGEKYEIRGKGSGSQFESFTTNYEYIAWWLGHAPSKEDEDIKIYISESKNGIKIDKLIR